MTTGPVPDWQALRDAMLANGFVQVGHGRGHLRFGYPGTEPPHGNLVLHTDPTAPEHADMIRALCADLLATSDRGTLAGNVLEAVSNSGPAY